MIDQRSDQKSIKLIFFCGDTIALFIKQELGYLWTGDGVINYDSENLLMPAKTLRNL